MGQGRNIMKPKERMAIPRQPVVETAPADRIKNFDEVVSGFDNETAVKEANRCLQCKKPGCINACPVHNNIPRFIKLLREGKIEEAYWVDRETTSLPAVCSRVCPHEFQCEGSCLRGKKGEPVAIGMLERFLVDWMVANNKNIMTPCAVMKNRKVAIIGSGPAGMTTAYHLTHAGYSCTIFESLPVLGGMLTVGIPAYRLPRDIIAAEFDALKNCGVEIHTNVTIGRDKTISELKQEGFEAVFIGVGAHNSRKLGIEGEDLEGVMQGVDYLRRVNIGENLNLGSNVVVVGGGNVAIDVARTALRTGSDQVFILYRRTEKEMPAAAVEIHHLKEEGVRIEFLAAPVKIHGKENRISQIECIRMKLGDCDASGRCRPVPIDGSNFMIQTDAIISAISQKIDHKADKGIDIKLTKWGAYDVDPVTLRTSAPWIFAAGDAVSGPQTVAKAVAGAKTAAESIERFLEGKDLRAGREPGL